MIVVSHRGPERFVRSGDDFERLRGAGGVVSVLSPLLAGSGATWVAAAIGDDDRAAVRAGAATSDEFDLRLLELDERVHRMHYELVSNATFWFLHHGLFDLPRRPVFDRRFREAWDAYRTVNVAFADAIAEAAPDGDTVLVQDYHLSLVPGLLRERRPDLRAAYFQHTPFCGPTSIRTLPGGVANELMSSLTAAPCGFNTPRWAEAFRACAVEVLGANAHPRPFAAPLGPDPAALEAAAATEEAAAAGRVLDDAVGDRAMLLRIDRIEPSKNIVRGFAAYDLLLSEHPELRERVVFVALVYPSREGLAEYLAYRQEVEQAVDRVNERWGTSGWQPVLLDTEDHYPRSVAALERYDVLLVNPLRDGLNLVAKEGPLLNRRNGVVALSREAGAFEELGPAVVEVQPFDVAQTADAILSALALDARPRAEMAGRLRTLAAARTPRLWLDDLVARAG